VTHRFVPYAKAWPHHPSPIQAFDREDSRAGAFAPEQSESEEEPVEKSLHQDLGQKQAPWPHEQAHNAMSGCLPPALRASSVASTTDTWLPSRCWSSQDSSGCFDAAAALSKAGRQEVVLGNLNDPIGPRRAPGRRASTPMGPSGLKPVFLEELGRQLPETPRANSSRMHKRPDMPFCKLGQESKCSTPVTEIEDPRSSQASRRNSVASTGSSQDAKQSAAILAELAAKHSLSASGRLTFPKCFGPRVLSSLKVTGSCRAISAKRRVQEVAHLGQLCVSDTA